ncbi:hypothetical protein ACFLXV_04470 [Chloroflexota bacterium]
MPGTCDEKFREWVEGRNDLEARIDIFERIRDIPYAIIPELNDHERYVDLLTIGKGSCTPKHMLLCEMYRRLGLSVLYVVYPFRWDEVELDYPPRLMKLARALPTSHHLACRVDINGKLILVDATLDTELRQMGLPVNESWDGVSDTRLAITPCGEEQIHHPHEAALLTPQYDDRSLAFNRELNRWLDAFRNM